MTQVDARPAPTPNPPTPPAQRDQAAASARSVRGAASTAARHVEEAAWWSARFAARHPVIAGGVLLGLAASTPVTLWEEGIALVVPVGAALCAGPARQKRALSLPLIAKSAKRMRRLKREWPRIMSDAGLSKTAKVTGWERRPRLSRVRVRGDVVIGRVDTSTVSMPAEKLADVQQRIRAAARAKLVKVNPIESHVAELRIFYRDPLARIIRLKDLPNVPGGDPVTVPVGIDDDGELLAKDLSKPSLIIGEQGSGKSCEAWTSLEGLRRRRVPLRLWVMDPKGGQEFGTLDGVAYAYEYDPKRWPDLIARYTDSLREVQARQRAKGLTGRKLTEFTTAERFNLLVVDELLALALLMKRPEKVWKKAAEDWQFSLSQGRSGGHGIVALSQNGKVNVLSEARDLFPNRTILRVNSDSMVGVVLNEEQAANRYPAHQIERPGEGYYAETGRKVRHYRSAFMTDPEIERVVRWLRGQR